MKLLVRINYAVRLDIPEAPNAKLLKKLCPPATGPTGHLIKDRLLS